MKIIPLDILYIGQINNTIKTVCLEQNGSYYDVSLNKLSNVKIIKSFEEAIKENGLELLVTDQNGNLKQYLTKDEINLLFKTLNRKLMLNSQIVHKIYSLSSSLTNIICDLLGLNVLIRPNTNYKLARRFDVNEIVVPAKKLRLFKKSLVDYISAMILSKQDISLIYETTERSKQIISCLNKAGIVENENLRNNTFSFIYKDGRLTINEDPFTKDKELQKIIKF